MMIILRLLDSALLPRNLTRNWSLRQFTIFFWTTRLEKDRKLELEKAKMMHSSSNLVVASRLLLQREVVVAWKSTPISYWISFLLQFSAQLLSFVLIPTFFKLYLSDWNPEPFALLDLSNVPLVAIYYLHAILLYSSVLLSRMAGAHLVALCLGNDCPVRQPLLMPWLSCSLGEFWSGRWNLTVQSCLKRIAFDPVASGLEARFGWSRKSSFAVATLCTFFFSGLLHEFCIVAFEKTSTGEQLVFFIIHGFLLVGEATVVALVYKATGYHLTRDSPRLAGMVYTQAILLITSPLMFNPYFRQHAFVDIFYPLSKDPTLIRYAMEILQISQNRNATLANFSQLFSQQSKSLSSSSM